MRPPERFLENRRGTAGIDFALLAPILIALLLTSFGFFGVIHGSYVTNKSTYTIGDLVSRQTEASTSFLNQMKATFQQLVVNDVGQPQLRISSLTRGGGTFTADWTYNSTNGSLSRRALPLTSLPDISDGDSIILTETVVVLKPVFDLVPIIGQSSLEFNYTATTRPRFVGRIARTQ